MCGSKPTYKDFCTSRAKPQKLATDAPNRAACDDRLVDLAIDTLQDIFYVFDLEGKFRYWNRRVVEVAGYTDGEIARMHPLDFFTGEDARLVDDGIREVLANGSASVEVLITTKNGNRIPYEFRGSRLTDYDGNVIGVCGSGRDVADRKKAEMELRKERNFAESLIETAHVIVLVLDMQGRIVRFNGYMEQLSGYRLQEVRGKDWFDTFLPQRDRLRIRDIFSHAVCGKPTSGNVNPIVTKDGRERFIEWCDSSLKNAEGEVIGVVAVGQDITDRLKAEESLRRAYDELETRVEERTADIRAASEREAELHAQLARIGRLYTMGEMASGLAHELNQPMAAIVLEIEAVLHKARAADDETLKNSIESLRFIAEQAHRAGDLIRRMREFIKHKTPQRSPLKVSEVIEEVLALSQKDLRESGVVVNVKIGRPPVEVFADKIQLQQVLLNLVLNAVEAMETTPIGRRNLDIEARAGEEFLEISIRDSGAGIPEDEINRIDEIFGPFFSTKEEGMGMGLAISRSIVESHGGRIWAARNPGRGATFTFTLPVAAGEKKK